MKALTEPVLHCFCKSTPLTVGLSLMRDLNALLFVQTVHLRTWKAVSLVLDVRDGSLRRWKALLNVCMVGRMWMLSRARKARNSFTVLRVKLLFTVRITRFIGEVIVTPPPPRYSPQ